MHSASSGKVGVMRNRNMIALTLALVLLFAASTAAQEVVFTSVVKSKYLGPDGAIWYDRPLLQSDIAVTLKNGIFFDVWGSTSDNKKSGWDKEIDLTFGYSKSIKKFEYSIEGSYYFVQGIDIFTGSIDVSIDFPVSPFIHFSGYWPAKRGGPKEGALLIGGLRARLDFGKGSGLALEASGRNDNGAFGYDPAWIAMGRADLDIALSKKFKILLGVEYARPLTVVGDGRKEEIVWKAGFSIRLK